MEKSLTLNSQQQYAATFNGKHLLVLAGAGTGKTHTIIARAKHLIESGIDPHRILILSFTRKSAAEIVERIKSHLQEAKTEGLTGSTFHSWCMSLIKSHPHIFPQAGYTLLDEDDQDSCFKLICGKNWLHKGADGKKIRPEAIKDVYSYMINVRCPLTQAIRKKLYDNAPETLNVENDKFILREVMSAYIDYKRKHKYIDYDDILLTVSSFLKGNENIRRQVARLYDHILIDEMQDTNPLQYDLLSSFYEDCHLFCVGDDAQSIYGFRGADFKSIHQFKDIVKDSEVCKLTINYRSTQEILDLSNWVIAQSPLDYDKQLIANRGAGFKPIFKHWSSEWEEANDIALSILQSHNELGKRWKDNLILSRTIWSSKKVEATLIKYKIPYTNYGGRGLMQSRHIRDVVSSMRIVSNYLDEIAWSRYLQLWKNIGEVTAADIIGKVITTDSLDDCLMILLEITQKKRLQEEIANTLITISDLQHSPSKAITQSLKIMQPWLEQLYKDDWSWRKEDFPLLVEISKSTGSISEFVAEYVLDPKLEITQKNGGKLEDHVVLSTIHSAKGLEADNVYVINASVDSYPTQRAILNGEEAVEEERRCLYVALTRAKDYLYVYRNIQSVHIADKELDKYFLNNVPETLYNSENIAVNYVPQLKNITGEQIRIDIYNDLDFK